MVESYPLPHPSSLSLSLFSCERKFELMKAIMIGREEQGEYLVAARERLQSLTSSPVDGQSLSWNQSHHFLRPAREVVCLVPKWPPRKNHSSICQNSQELTPPRPFDTVRLLGLLGNCGDDSWWEESQ